MERIPGRLRFLEWLVELLLIFALLPSILYPAAQIALLRPEPYRQAIAAQRLDQRLADVLAEWLTRPDSNSQAAGLQAGLAHLSQEQLAGELATILPQRWAELQANRLADELLLVLNLQSESLVLRVDFRPLKQAVNSNQARLADSIVTSWPACSAQDLLDLGIMALTGELSDIPYCQPPQALQPVAAGFVRGLLRLAAGSLPDELDLAGMLPWEIPDTWLAAYRPMRTVFNIAPVASLLLSLFALAACWPNRTRAAGIAGRSLITASVSLAVLLVSGYLLASIFLPDRAGGWLSILPASLTGILLSTMKAVGMRYALSQAVWLLLAFLGGVALVWVPRVLLASRD